MGVGAGVLGSEFSSECLFLSNKGKGPLLRWGEGVLRVQTWLPSEGATLKSGK